MQTPLTPIFLLAEHQGESEARHNSTLVGTSGVELLRMLHETKVLRLSPPDRDLIDRYYRTSDSSHLIQLWSHHPGIHRTNVFHHHPPNNDPSHFLGPVANALPGYPPLRLAVSRSGYKPGGAFVRREFAADLDRLGDELLEHNPNIVVCLGNVALWALSGSTGVAKLRGTTLTSTITAAGFKLLPTYHPSAVLRNWDLRPTVLADLAKAGRESAYPEIRRPHREIWTEPTLADIREFFTLYVHGCSLLSVDIETAGDRITCIGFAPTSSLALVIPFDDERAATGNYWPTAQDERECWKLITNILSDPAIPKLFQNGAYDIAFLWRSMKVKVLGAEHDTMLCHHALQPEALKSLGFLGSIYSDEGSWKGMRKRKKSTKRDE